METINRTIAGAKEEVKNLIKQAQEKQLEAQPGRTLLESFENRVNQVRRGLQVFGIRIQILGFRAGAICPIFFVGALGSVVLREIFFS
jgi:peptide subunit release factor RF-3